MYKTSIIPPLRIAFLMWLFFAIQVYFTVDLGFLGILPRTFFGLIGIFTAPLVHGTTGHLISNTFPLLFLGMTLYIFYDRIATRVFFQCYFFTNILVWIFGRPFYHIGSSGLVYALATFLISFGIFRQNPKSIFISLTILLLYGGLIYGIFPQNLNVSWESHLLGAIVGVGNAFGMSKVFKIDN